MSWSTTHRAATAFARHGDDVGDENPPAIAVELHFDGCGRPPAERGGHVRGDVRIANDLEVVTAFAQTPAGGASNGRPGW